MSICLSVKLTIVCSDAEDPGPSTDASSAMGSAAITKPLVLATQVDKIDFHQVHRHSTAELPPACGEVFCGFVQNVLKCGFVQNVLKWISKMRGHPVVEDFHRIMKSIAEGERCVRVRFTF